MAALYHSSQDTSIPSTSGIYRIACLINQKIYIGSAIDLRKRRREHFYSLRHNTHNNPKLQRAWNKHGEESFTFEVVEYVLPAFLLEREQYWFDKLKPFGDNGYNIDHIAGSRYGWKASETTREKMGRGRRGKPPHNIGQKTSPEICAKIRVARLGFKHRPETIDKMCADRIGHPVSAKALNALKDASAKRMKTLVFIDPDGTEYIAHGIKPFCREHHLDYATILQVVKGERSQHKGWKAHYPETDLG